MMPMFSELNTSVKFDPNSYVRFGTPDMTEGRIPNKSVFGNSVKKCGETNEQRRVRALDAYSKLQDLVERYGVKLSRHFSPDDDPDEMEEEYIMQTDKKNKTNHVKFLKQVLLNIICGAEFLNQRYFPSTFYLKDWSKEMAANMDDYTEVLEEFYDKYKDRLTNPIPMSPEARILSMVATNMLTFHLSQSLFGSSNHSAPQSNVLSKLMKNFQSDKLSSPNAFPNTLPNTLPNTFPKSFLNSSFGNDLISSLPQSMNEYPEYLRNLASKIEAMNKSTNNFESYVENNPDNKPTANLNSELII